MLVQISRGLCFLPNNNFFFADSIDFPNKFAENVCVCMCVYVCTRAGLRASAFTLCLFVLLPKDSLFPEIPFKGFQDPLSTHQEEILPSLLFREGSFALNPVH